MDQVLLLGKGRSDLLMVTVSVVSNIPVAKIVLVNSRT